MLFAACLMSCISYVEIFNDRDDDAYKEVAAIVERASMASDLDESGLILSSLVKDENKLLLAFLRIEPDDRTAYILHGGHWGSRADVTWKDRERRQHALVKAVSSKPSLIKFVIRAERYDRFMRSRAKVGGAATLNSFNFFGESKYIDDVIESHIESMRKATSGPAEAITSIHGDILISASKMEIQLLDGWQLLCGLCDRPALIDQSDITNWRGRFSELDAWFQKNRPFITWDDDRGCVKIDEEAKQWGRATSRELRFIPELRPPWLSK